MKILESSVPVGIDPVKVLKNFIIALALSVIISLFWFVKLSDEISSLYYNNHGVKTLINGIMLPPFYETLGNYLIGFKVVAAAAAVMCVYNYLYHFLDSKSIYTMKRLPQRFELIRRCLLMPAMAALASFLLCFLMLMIFLAAYMLLAPEGCAAPGQFIMLWQNIL